MQSANVFVMKFDKNRSKKGIVVGAFEEKCEICRKCKNGDADKIAIQIDCTCMHIIVVISTQKKTKKFARSAHFHRQCTNHLLNTIHTIQYLHMSILNFAACMCMCNYP